MYLQKFKVYAFLLVEWKAKHFQTQTVKWFRKTMTASWVQRTLFGVFDILKEGSMYVYIYVYKCIYVYTCVYKYICI